MIKIENNNEIQKYISKYELNSIFSNDMKEYMVLYMFHKNDFICREDELIENMFFLVDGKAKVSKHLENGKSLLISFYVPLTIIGDVEFIKNNKTDCSVQAIEDTYCVGISMNIVRSILMKDCTFLIKICNYLGEKLTKGSNNSSINLLYPLESRLASYIVAFITPSDNVDKKFIIKENYIEIAELLGTSYRHLNRIISKFCSEGILQKQGKEYKIEDFERLLYLAGDLYK